MPTLLLPGFEPPAKSRCSWCGAWSNDLHQWHPHKQHVRFCAACVAAMPFPREAFEREHERGDQLTESEYTGREWVAGILWQITERARERKSQRRPAEPKPNPYQPHWRLQRSMPICARCGGIHSHWVISNYSDRCPRCEQMDRVDTLLRMPKLLEMHAGSAEDEDILDWMYKRDPAWFDGCAEYDGFMPDYWFEIKAKGAT